MEPSTADISRGHGAGRLVVQRGTAAPQADARPRDESIDDSRHGFGVRTADVPVSQDAGERRDGAHQRRHVPGHRGHVADPGHHRFHGRRKVRQECPFDQFAEGGQAFLGPGPLDRSA